MRAFTLFILFLLAAFPVQADEMADLQVDNQLLQEELQLARGSKLYVIVDLRDRQILIKASGVTVKQLSILEYSIQGALPEIETRRLAAKKTFLSPKRPEVKIVDKNKKEEPRPGMGTLNALELGDMPGVYRLVLDDGSRIAVRSDTEGFWATLGRWWQGTWGNIFRIFSQLWGSLSGRTYTELLVTLPVKDAQQLYWSFDENAPCLIRPPATGP